MKFDASKIIEYYNNLNDQARYCLLVVAVFLVVLLDVIFLVLPQMADIAKVHDQIKQMSENTQEVLADRGQTNQLKGHLEVLRSQYNALNLKVRTIQEIPTILSTISSIANKYGVNIDKLVPKKEQQEVLKEPALDGKYYALPIVMKAHGGYHMFGHFLNKLENENLYFIVKDFIIQNDDKDPKSRLFSMTINIILVDRSSMSKNI